MLVFKDRKHLHIERVKIILWCPSFVYHYDMITGYPFEKFSILLSLIKLAYNNNHAKSSVWAISGQFNVLPFGEITAAMGG